MKEYAFYMEFNADGSVNLYDGPTLCAIMADVQSAKERARELCPDGYKLRLLRK